MPDPYFGRGELHQIRAGGFLFSTTDHANHGNPDPLRCPSNRARRAMAMALYYHTNGRPKHEVSAGH
ncbi:MAG TPA: hypothetical protein VJT72_24490 [Pseudonocardiaceae bacterium]|nr:hypothetical protein [Pseudonocardiaceae bacterium]